MKIRPEDEILGFALHPSGRVDAIKQGSGLYGAGFGEGAFTETAFGANVALSQSVFGWAAAYSVSTWVYRCIEVRKSAIHRMPWAVYSKRTKQPVPKHPLMIALKRNRQKFFKQIEQSQLLYGETFIELCQNEYHFVGDVNWLNNLGTAVLVGAGHIIGYSYTAMQGGQPKSLDVGDVAFMKTENPFNDLRGMSPTEVILDEVAIDKNVARVVRAYYANDTRVGILLIPKSNLTPADSERFMAEWKKQHQGVNKAGKPVLMPYDMTVERVQEPATLDDVQLRESTRREIAAGYGVPLSLAGGWDDAKYQSLPEQRKSFYEETIIPECDNIAEFINADVMPYFDDSGSYEFRYDYISILALTEDAQKKNDIYSNRLVSGLITRAEARQALGHPVRPVDDVYYIPTGATVVPANEQALVTPSASEVDTTAREQQQQAPPKLEPSNGSKPPEGPSTEKPRQIEQPQEPKQLPPGKAIAPPQDNALDELAAWEKKALNNGALKAANFVAYVVPQEVQDVIRAELRTLGKMATKAQIRAVFATAKAPPPSVVADYWRHYDGLEGEIGSAWLDEYMARVWEGLEQNIRPDMPAAMIQELLDAHHQAFTVELIGEEQKPGPLVKLVMTGMAAGNEALAHHGAANPHRPVKALDIDWNLLAHEARDYAKEYAGQLIRNVDDTTRKAVADAVAKWVESGEGLDSLKAALKAIFEDKARAALVAQTEATRAYSQGSLERYRRADVQKVQWMSVNDSAVCADYCKPLVGTTAAVGEGFKTKDGVGFPPAHVGCRCWLKPVSGED